MGPPDDATYEEWQDAFVRENKLRMTLLAALDALVAQWSEDADGLWHDGEIDSAMIRRQDRDELAAEIAKHRTP